MNFNPMMGAWVVANNANIARMNALRAQEEAEEAAERAQRRLLELERQFEIERQEHAWALFLIQRGQTESSAKREASKETRRQEIYPRLEADLSRMMRLQPKEASRSDYDRDIASRQQAIEAQRTKTVLGPHPLVISTILMAVMAMSAWLLVGGSALQRAVGAAFAAAVTLAIAFIMRRKSRQLWMWYRGRAVAKATDRATRETTALPGFVTWKYDRFVIESKPYWAAQGYAFHDRDELKRLGESMIDGSRYNRVVSLADRLLSEPSNTEVDLLFGAIEECIYAGQLTRADSMISRLTPDGQKFFRQRIQEVREEGGEPRDARTEARRKPPLVRPTQRDSNSSRGRTPSRVPGLQAKFVGPILEVTWSRPTVNPEAVSSYVVHVARVGGSGEWTFESENLFGTYEISGLSAQADYSVAVEVKSGTQLCGRGKAVVARSGSASPHSPVTAPPRRASTAKPPCALGGPLPNGYKFCPMCGTDHR
jgi:hypothetical protein